MILLPLGCYDLVIGVEWLITLGDITWNFNKLSMEFKTQGKCHVLCGSIGGSLHTVKKHQLSKALSFGVHLAILTVLEHDSSLSALTTHADSTTVHPAIEDVLSSFEDVFRVPSSLPPSRSGFDHCIPLQQGVDPINKRPTITPNIKRTLLMELLRIIYPLELFNKVRARMRAPLC